MLQACRYLAVSGALVQVTFSGSFTLWWVLMHGSLRQAQRQTVQHFRRACLHGVEFFLTWL